MFQLRQSVGGIASPHRTTENGQILLRQRLFGSGNGRDFAGLVLGRQMMVQSTGDDALTGVESNDLLEKRGICRGEVRVIATVCVDPCAGFY
jgi:hypothetical protein